MIGCKNFYVKSVNNPTTPLYDLNNNIVPEPTILKKITDDRKFELIS
jgi:hypothetical protein